MMWSDKGRRMCSNIFQGGTTRLLLPSYFTDLVPHDYCS